MSNINIDTCAMIVELNVSTWTARKLDRSVTDEVVVSKSAQSKDAARVNKSLMAGRPELDEIQSYATMARNYVYDHTLPWSDSGQRLLPSVSFVEFNKRMTDFEDQFDAMVETFLSIYPTLITAQAMALGSMFKRGDYPSPEELRRKFAFRVNYLPVPATGDFRVDVGNEAQRQLRERMEKLAAERVEAAVGDVRRRVIEHLERMSDRLTTDTVDGVPKNRRFHDTLVSGAYELCDLLQSLNITGDPKIEQTRRGLEAALSGASAEDLRKDHDARDEVKKQVDALLGAWKFEV